MRLNPAARKLALTVHLAFSVGWFGGVLAALGLAVVGLASDDPQRVRAVYIAMEATAWYVLVPLSFASLVTGIVQSLGTVWGLFRHYWVVSKFAINLIATAILLLYTQTLGDFAASAADPTVPAANLGDLRDPSPLLHASAALVLLAVAMVLAVYKPRGLTRYGRRKLTQAHLL